jgi:hypothetical protein
MKRTVSVQPVFVIIAALLLSIVTSGHAAYSYSGTVKNGSGQGVDGATVTLSGTSVSTQTTAGGTFILSGSTQGRTIKTSASITKKLLAMGKNTISIFSVDGMPARLVIVDLVGRVHGVLNASPGKSGMMPIEDRKSVV